MAPTPIFSFQTDLRFCADFIILNYDVKNLEALNLSSKIVFNLERIYVENKLERIYVEFRT